VPDRDCGIGDEHRGIRGDPGIEYARDRLGHGAEPRPGQLVGRGAATAEAPSADRAKTELPGDLNPAQLTPLTCLATRGDEARLVGRRSDGEDAEHHVVPPELPDGVDGDRARPRYPDAATWTRRVLLGALLVLVVLGLANTFGQSPTVSHADTSTATLRVTAPADLRGGLIFQVRVDITAHTALAKPSLVFSPAWFEAMTLNSLAPQPSTETMRNGAPVFHLSPIPAGRRATYWFYFQVNPTNVGWHRTENLTLIDGSSRIATINRTITIYP
jgi:hypothetical protein